ncbi:MAG: S41 family peptidase [Pseudomonadota bacterium]
MGITFKQFGLVGLGMAAGLAGTLHFSATAQKAAAGALPLDELRQLADVFGLIKSDYVEPVEDKKLLTEAISGMVASLDPHSVYLDQKAYREMNESMQGRFVGIGIEVAMEDGYVVVVSPIEDSPAFRAGVRAGDLVTRIDNASLKGLTLDEVIKKMRGQPRSKISLTIARKGEEKPWPVAMVREEIHVQSVKGKIVEPGYAWLRVSQFQQMTLDELAKKAAALVAQEPHMKGLVLDLRNDPGGLLPGAIGVSSAFLPKDAEIVSTNGQLPESRQTMYGRRDFYAPQSATDPLAKLPAALKTVPMVVLVNAGSASASEIVAGALQDYKRAIIMGSQTFGKGSVQTLRKLTADTAIKLTTARYYTPHGRSIQARGIVPDLAVDDSAEGDAASAAQVREADLDKHLNNEADKDAPAAPAHQLTRDEERRALDKRRKPLDFGGKDDFQLAQALNHFKGLPVQLSKNPPRPDAPLAADGKPAPAAPAKAPALAPAAAPEPKAGASH